MSKIIRVSEEVYNDLLNLKAFLIIKMGKDISFDEAIKFLLEKIKFEEERVENVRKVM